MYMTKKLVKEAMERYEKDRDGKAFLSAVIQAYYNGMYDEKRSVHFAKVDANYGQISGAIVQVNGSPPKGTMTVVWWGDRPVFYLMNNTGSRQWWRRIDIDGDIDLYGYMKEALEDLMGSSEKEKVEE